MFDALIEELGLVIDALQAGDPVDEEAVNAMMLRIQASVPTMSRSEVMKLNERVGCAIQLVLAQQERVSLELQKIRKGRTALGGYNHIRRHQTSQRLCRKA